MSREADFPFPPDLLLRALEQQEFALAVCTREGRLRWVNEAWERLTQYTATELLELPHWSALVHPTEHDRLKEMNAQRVSGEPVPDTYDSLFLRRDGSALPVEISIKTLQQDDETWILAVVRDITARRAAEEGIHHLASIVDSTSDAVVSSTNDGTITSWNPGAERMFGYTPAMALGHSIRMLAPDGGPYDMQGLVERVTRGARIVGHETTRRHRDGSLVSVSLSAAPLLDESGAVVGLSGIYRDVSERVRAEEESRKRAEAERVSSRAEAANRAKSEFLATMSHEIRTPMNAVIGMSGLLLETDLTAEQREYARTVREAAQALLTLINDILDFSKIEAGRIELEQVDFDAGAVVEEVGEVLASLAHLKGIELAVAIDPELPSRVTGDPSRIRQVVMNLVSNAVKFTHRGEVVVSLRVVERTEADVTVRFEVRDTGVGVPVDLQERMFESFTQADTSTTRRFGGTGLGLAISRQLLGLMGGQVGVTSAPGDGSDFWFTLTLPVASGPSSSPYPATVAGARVLVVDAVDTTGRILGAQLRAWGLDPDIAITVGEAVALAGGALDAGAPFAAAVADFQLPDGDGVEVGRALDPTPVVVLSSAGGREAKRRATPNVRAWLVKPARRSQLYDALATCLGVPPNSTDRVHPASSPDKRIGRILVVDDNPVNQRLADLLLTKAGYTVDGVANGAEAVEAMTSTPYDAIVMDCEMPVMDGYEAAAEIRRREDGGERVPIVAVTASALQEDVDRAFAVGMDAHVAKPIDRHLLETTLDRLVRQRDTGAGRGATTARPVVDARVLDARKITDLLALDGDGRALRSLVSTFAEEVEVQLRVLSMAVSEGDPEKVRVCAHTMRGAASTFGARHVVSLLRSLEESTRAGRPATNEEVGEVQAAVAVLSGALRQLVEWSRASSG